MEHTDFHGLQLKEERRMVHLNDLSLWEGRNYYPQTTRMLLVQGTIRSKRFKSTAYEREQMGWRLDRWLGICCCWPEVNSSVYSSGQEPVGCSHLLDELGFCQLCYKHHVSISFTHIKIHVMGREI